MNKRLALCLACLCLGSTVLLADKKRQKGLRKAGPSFSIVEASNGFGQLLPHLIKVPDANGDPTRIIVPIRSHQDLVDNVRPQNPVLPVTEFPALALLPSANSGNHYYYVRFSQPVDADSFLTSAASAGAVSQLTGSILALQVNPLTGATSPLAGRVFVNGFTYGSPDPSHPGELLFEQWVTLGLTGQPVAADARGVGFPGTETPFHGAELLVDPSTVVFVADGDANLATHDAFPAGVQLQLLIRTGVESTAGERLAAAGFAGNTVGVASDVMGPEVRTFGALVDVAPGNGELGVDPATTIRLAFTEQVQPLSIGPLDGQGAAGVSPSIQLQFGPSTSKVDMPFSARPLSVYDFSRWELIPVTAFPGKAPDLGHTSCGDFAQVDVVVNADQLEDLRANRNVLSPSTFFETGEGLGLVNAPVTPDAIYVARTGVAPGISVIDLNGFGQGCGSPFYDPINPILQGNSNFPNNPNVAVQGSLLIPPLSVGFCTYNGGSAGVFSLAKDSSLSELLARAPTMQTPGDMALGQALDTVFNNATPFGCQAGGGNVCASTALKSYQILGTGTATVIPGNLGAAGPLLGLALSAENLASWAPHPNPPPLVFPPTCQDPLILGQEPTSIVTTLPLGSGGIGLNNLLLPSNNPLGIPAFNVPPQGLLTRLQNLFFEGPSPPEREVFSCPSFTVRQQIGQFLYVVDRAAGELVVLNSNRFVVLERIALPDPTSLAMAPNLDFLAVTNQAAGTVSFIDVNPASASFHQVVQTVGVGSDPIGIAWTPDNEDILVCNSGDGTLSLISAFSLTVRKTVGAGELNSPFEVAITPRQTTFGRLRNVYYAYILCGDGRVALFESGPDGINGWGYDDVIGFLPYTFDRPTAIQPDPTTLQSRAWITHLNRLDSDGTPIGEVDGGAVTRCGIVGGLIGQLPITDPEPQIRFMDFGIDVSIGSERLTGVPVDLAFDNQTNVSALKNGSNPFSAGSPRFLNGKSLHKEPAVGMIRPANEARFLFLSIPSSYAGPGSIDVIDLLSGDYERFDTDPFLNGVQSIRADGATIVADYFRQ